METVRTGGGTDLFWRKNPQDMMVKWVIAEEGNSALNAMQVSDMGIRMVEGSRSDRFRGTWGKDQGSVELKGGRVFITFKV